MRTSAILCIAFGFSIGLSAQIRGVGSVVHPAGGPGTPGVTRTVGSVVNPAGGVPKPVIPAARGNVVANRSKAIYAYPVYIGGYYSVPYISQYDPSQLYAPAQSQPNVTVVMAPQQPVTPVIINYNYPAAPANQDTAGAPAQAADQDTASADVPAHYLIALKDHTIYVATAYWVDGDTLHYFTAGNVHNQASLALVDRDFTQRLNKEAGVDVSLPASIK